METPPLSAYDDVSSGTRVLNVSFHLYPYFVLASRIILLKKTRASLLWSVNFGDSKMTLILSVPMSYDVTEMVCIANSKEHRLTIT